MRFRAGCLYRARRGNWAVAGVPVFRILRTFYDTEGRPLEVQDSVAAADRHNFRYEVGMR